MYLRTRLLLGIAVVTLVALAISLIVPLASAREDVLRETASSTRLARLLHAVEWRVAATDGRLPDVLAAAAAAIRRSEPLRHVKIELLDADGIAVAASPSDDRAGGWLAQGLLSAASSETLTYPLAYRGAALGQLRVLANPQSEIEEIEQRVVRDLTLLTLTILAMAASIYFMVRRGLMPIAQIQAALTRLEAGDLATRLPHFRLRDLNDISQRFNRCATAMQEAAAQRRVLTRRLIEVEEQERKRLARELHDELGQSLTAIKVDAAYIVREAEGHSPRIETCARGVEKLAGEIMEIIRSMLARLRPHGLETVGLRATLQELVDSWQMRVADKFHCAVHFAGPVNELPSELTVTVYRLVQECLTNAVRYSRAHSIAIRLTVDSEPKTGAPQQISLRVEESGVPAEGARPAANGSGLLGMRERVEAHGGVLTVEMAGSGGLSLQASIPVTAGRETW